MTTGEIHRASGLSSLQEGLVVREEFMEPTPAVFKKNRYLHLHPEMTT